MMRTVTKLVTKAKNVGHSLYKPANSETFVLVGSWRFRASNVMANAKTPSLNASILPVSRSSRLSRLSGLMIGGLDRRVRHHPDLNLPPGPRNYRCLT